MDARHGGAGLDALRRGDRIGLALPNVIALAMETVPSRLRVTAIVLVNCGYPLGGAWVGQDPHLWGPDHLFRRWHRDAGRAAACVALLPKSPLLLARRPGRTAELARLLRRLGGAFTSAPPGFALREAPPPRSRVARLDRARATLLLWLVNFAGLAMVHFFINWLPSIIVGSG